MDGTRKEAQSEEIEALQAIYDGDLVELSSNPPCFMLNLSSVDLPSGNIYLKVTFPPEYPDVPPDIEIPLRSSPISKSQSRDLLTHLSQISKELIGEAAVFNLVTEATDWLNENYTAEIEEIETVEETKEEVMVNVSLKDAKLASGKWDFVIGLVGKPSAGKSTFFNAATSQTSAKTAAHPFTTIEPNIGKGWYSIPCPCDKLPYKCDAAYGHNHLGERLVPVLLKDVAGLVPGACEGKGRGNKFLSDLLDADVLMHIIDSSGCTNEKGEETKDYDPCQDVVWLQNEIKEWILGNIRDKWESIKKRPAKLINMFTGYHANLSTIHAAFISAGVDEKKLSSLSSWEESVLENLVKHFLLIRFPIFLVLNKADAKDSAKNIEKIHETFPDLPTLPVCAKHECFLQAQREKGNIDYEIGTPSFTVNGDVSTVFSHTQELLSRFGSTNVHKALNMAVSLRQPAYAFPVQCLDNLTSIDKYKGEPPGRLRDCISLRPHTTVVELCTVMLHYPVSLLAGDFIRAEGCGQDMKKRILRKDEVVNESNYIIKIMTNRKVSPVKPR